MLSFTVSSYVLLVLAVFAVRFIYLEVTSPLFKIPNASIFAPFTDLWLFWLRCTKRSDTVVNEAHKRLGPVIRLGPNTLSVACIENGVTTIYGGNLDKSTFYSVFANFGHEVMFSMLTAKPHAERRRQVAFVYSNSYIQASAELNAVLKRVLHDDVLPRIQRSVEANESIEVHVENKAYATDVTSAYLFGLQNGTRLLENEAEKQAHCDSFMNGFDNYIWLHEFPTISALREKVIGKIFAGFKGQAFAKFMKSIMSLVAAAQPLVSDQGLNRPVVYSQFYNAVRKTGSKEDNIDTMLGAELMDHTIAAHALVSIALTYNMWRLSINPSWQARLRDELRAMGTEVLTGKQIDNLPVLDAVVHETFRVNPPTFGSFPRLAPAGGLQIGEFVNIPAGTIMSTCITSLHRNEKVFPEPETWAPERWLNADTDKRKEMNRWMWHFGSGARGCIGSHLAVRMIKALLADIYREYSTTVVGNPDMRQYEELLGHPADGELHLNFSKA